MSVLLEEGLGGLKVLRIMINISHLYTMSMSHKGRNELSLSGD